MITDPLELSRRFEAMAQAFESRKAESERKVAARFVDRVDARIKAAVGPDRVLSGTTRTTGRKRSNRGGKAAGRIQAYAKAEKAGTLVAVRGPLQLAENDVAKHVVVSQYVKGAGYTRVNAKGKTVKGRSTRESRQASVLFGLGAAGGGRRAVLHWGNNYARYTFASSKGRHPWRDGVAEASKEIPSVHAQVQLEAIASAVKG